MKIKSGENFTLLLTDRGEVYSWGINESGQLGIGTVDKVYHMPTKIVFKLGIPIKYISVGLNFAAAIDYDYNVYIWGDNNYKMLGFGDNKNRSVPTTIECLTEKLVKKIYCKRRHIFALTQNGEVYYNNVNTLTKINFPNNTIIKKLYTGYYHSFAIDTCSKIYSWGYNYKYQLCKGDNIRQNSPFIASVLEYFNINKIVCLTNSSILLADNKLYSIGYGLFGELGLGIRDTNKLTLIKEGVVKVWGNDCTVFCKMCNGDIYAWGSNNNGQFGIGNKLNQNIPIKLNIQLDIKCINYCRGVTYAVTTSGEIYTWGDNELVSKESILEPTLFTYFLDNCIEVKSMNRIKSARKN